MTLSRKKLADLNNKLDRVIESRRLESGSPILTWRNKPVIPVGTWELIIGSNFRKALGCIPNGYTDLYEKNVIRDRSAGQINATELEVWKDDYFAFLEHIGNPVRGRELCAGCILSPSEDPYGLRRIIVNAVDRTALLQKIPTKSDSRVNGETEAPHEKQENGHVVSQVKDDVNTRGLYPCSVHNRFQCPYKTSEPPRNDDGLIRVGESLASIEAALLFASEFSDQGFNDRHKVNFERGTLHTGPEVELRGIISDLPDPRAMTVTRISEIYQTLTTPERLEKVLYQYFSYEQPESNLKHVRDNLVKFVAQNKNKLKMEDLLDGFGRNLEDSEEEYMRMQKRAEHIAWPSAKCFSCDSNICHIHCSNCDVYMCKAHWRIHMEQKHKETSLRYPPTF